jgi:hypothetical protein
MKPEERMKIFQLVVAGEQCVSWEQFKRKVHDKKWLASAIREKLIQKKSEVDFLEDVLEEKLIQKKSEVDFLEDVLENIDNS